ncbi:MAG: stage III sporulation protein AF [Clostridia bacterium]|nr:stage III sporulation protein AF [Clostridia bacterium]
MSGWLIGIVGVVSLGVLIEVLLPEGENSKYIRGIFSIIVIFVIISPLPKLAKGDYIKGFTSQSQEISIDNEYYESVKDDIQIKVEDNLKEKLEKAGYNDLSFDIQFDEEYVFMINKIVVRGKDLDEQRWQELTEFLRAVSGNAKIEKA